MEIRSLMATKNRRKSGPIKGFPPLSHSPTVIVKKWMFTTSVQEYSFFFIKGKKRKNNKTENSVKIYATLVIENI